VRKLPVIRLTGFRNLLFKGFMSKVTEPSTTETLTFFKILMIKLARILS